MYKQTSVKDHFDKLAPDYDYFKMKNEYYYNNLKNILKKLILSKKNIMEVGCGTGELIAFLNPKYGYGVDLSSEMIKRANSKFESKKNLIFSTEWPSGCRKYFDYIFMADVIEHIVDPLVTLRKISSYMGPDTKFVNTMMNPVWIPLEKIYEFLGLKMHEGPHKRIKYEELRAIMENAGMKVVKHGYKLLMPIEIPILTKFINRHLEKYLKKYAFVEYVVLVKS